MNQILIFRHKCSLNRTRMNQWDHRRIKLFQSTYGLNQEFLKFNTDNYGTKNIFIRSQSNDFFP